MRFICAVEHFINQPGPGGNALLAPGGSSPIAFSHKGVSSARLGSKQHDSVRRDHFTNRLIKETPRGPSTKVVLAISIGISIPSGADIRCLVGHFSMPMRHRSISALLLQQPLTRQRLANTNKPPGGPGRPESREEPRKRAQPRHCG